MKIFQENDESLYMSLAVQTVLFETMKDHGFGNEELSKMVDNIQLEALRFKEAAEALNTSAGKLIPQMKFILSHLRDEHLASSYFEARSLGLDPDFVNMLRIEIIRRGMTSICIDDVDQ